MQWTKDWRPDPVEKPSLVAKYHNAQSATERDPKTTEMLRGKAGRRTPIANAIGANVSATRKRRGR